MDKIEMDNFLGKNFKLVLAGLLFVGFCIGYGSHYSSKDLPKESNFSVSSMVNKFELGVVKEGLRKCKIVGSNVALKNEPSMLYGVTNCIIPYGVTVEYLETIPSSDMDSTAALAAFDFEISQLLHRNIKVAKGTPLSVIKKNSDGYVCSFISNGKRYSKTFAPSQIVLAYTGEWHRVKIYNQEGFIRAIDAGKLEYM